MSLLAKRERFFFLFVNGLYKLLLLDKRRWIQAQKRLKTEEFEYFAGVFGQTPSPVRVLPLIQEGELFAIIQRIRYMIE